MLVLTIGVGDGLTEFAANTDPEASKRRTTRIVQAVPLTVAGVDALGRPFQERTSTLIINCHGCRYQSKHYVLKNMRSEEHTSELQSPCNLVCRLLLEKKKRAYTRSPFSAHYTTA